MLARLLLAFLMVNTIGAEQRANGNACTADQASPQQIQTLVVETTPFECLSDNVDSGDDAQVTAAFRVAVVTFPTAIISQDPALHLAAFQQPQARAPPSRSNV